MPRAKTRARALRLAITADLHWGHREGSASTKQLAEFLRQSPPDVLVLAGDIGTGSHFEECLALFSGLPSLKALSPGNHDLWVSCDAPYDSLDLYETRLPQAAARQDFIYLDHGPLLLPEFNLALVGSINWYDYSWAIDGMLASYPGEEERLVSKRFTRGKHNDANFIRWRLDDISFTSLVTATFRRHLVKALTEVSKVIIVTHHPAFYGLSFPRSGPPTSLDGYLWDAFAGNVGMEQVLLEFANQIPFVFSGHTHIARETQWGNIHGFNVGSDYPTKRLLLLDWPEGTVEAQVFG